MATHRGRCGGRLTSAGRGFHRPCYTSAQHARGRKVGTEELHCLHFAATLLARSFCAHSENMASIAKTLRPLARATTGASRRVRPAFTRPAAQ